MSRIDEAILVAKPRGGSPQVGRLLPLRWAILLDEMVNKLSANSVYYPGYENDRAIIVKGKFGEVNNWCNREKLASTAMETQIVTFIKKRNLRKSKPVRLTDVMSTVKQAKCLEDYHGLKN